MDPSAPTILRSCDRISRKYPCFAFSIEIWNSENGISRLNSSQYKNDFYQLANFYQAQNNPIHCSSATALMLKNAFFYENIPDYSNVWTKQIIFALFALTKLNYIMQYRFTANISVDKVFFGDSVFCTYSTFYLILWRNPVLNYVFHIHIAV